MTREPENNNGGYLQDRSVILYRLDRIQEELDEVKASCARVEISLESLRLKATLWGALAGALPGLVTAAALLMRGHLG